MAGKKSFLILPREGFVSAKSAGRAGARSTAPAKAITAIRMEGKTHKVKVLDSAHERGAKLVEMDADAGADLARRQAEGDVRVFENKIYRPMAIGIDDVRPTAPPTASTGTGGAAPTIPPPDMHIGFTVTDSSTGAAVQGATVMVFLDQAQGKGVTAVTDSRGQCSTPWYRRLATIEQLWVMPPSPPVYWGSYAKAVPLQDSFALAIDPVEADYPDCARVYYPEPKYDPKSGVTVGIVDTGVAAEPVLNLVGGCNTVTGEDPGDYGSNGDPHGTHVAGLVGASGPKKGNAPGVALRSYRVFASGGQGATSFAIVKAVMTAVSDGCDVINMSLGVGGADPPLREAIEHARQNGVLVVAAGNNNGGGPVGSPACYRESVGVSAVGQTGCLPPHSQAEAHVTDTRGTDPNCFFADFSCVGDSLKLSGPGVGVVSTVPGGGYGQMSGTSMASPLMAGYAASLLSRSPKILSAKRGQSRSKALEKALLSAAKSLGLARNQQGFGLPV